MVTTEITVSKREYIFACLWACRHGRPEVSVHADHDGFVFLEPYLSQFGANCVNLGTADVSAYCDDIESETAADQVLECMDRNCDWRLWSYRVESDYRDLGRPVLLNWVD